ncbi:FkbM family methyltransferase [Flavivirga eckloniae]|uniref:Methyltransferase FkbM domain-containing protein n=1 Tax=Flavivirga eckloniae TaxID=1803846 RepID=A0A2K9PM78_9FLAO|nr:FkbM family methyltransferase [Flavivirga eckloniae]AUP78174.1 hypothetical protein C1H87_05370 [Flavivirga eckloniae]
MKKYIKKRIKHIINKKGYRISSVSYFNFLESILYQKIKKEHKINFIQVGANDGKRFDPIYEFIKYNRLHVSGYVLEPIQDYFNDLKETYKDFPNIKPVNYAIHNTLTETSIFKVAKQYEDKLPEFALGIASFDKDHHKKTNIPSQYITEEKVKCTSLSAFINENNIKQLDLLVLDAEGYDYDIIMNMDFDSVSPSIIHFEHGFRTDKKAADQFSEIRELLSKYDYQLLIDKSDVTAIKTMLLYEN